MKTFYKLKEKCVMCDEEEASVTVRPCGHVYCQGMLLHLSHLRIILKNIVMNNIMGGANRDRKGHKIRLPVWLIAF